MDHSKCILTESNISDCQKEQELLCYAVKLIHQAIETHGVTLDFLAVPGVVTPGLAASPIKTIIYCSEVSVAASIMFSILLNLYSNLRPMHTGHAVCLHS